MEEQAKLLTDTVVIPMEKWARRDGKVDPVNKSICTLWPNDRAGKTFAEIADIIQSEPEGLCS